MGWTHYWYREIELPQEQFKAAVNDCKKILADLDIRLGDAVGKNNPVLTDEAIIFNGLNNECEPFVFRRIQYPKPGKDKVFTYCKTEHMPYDLAVQCCLIVLKHHLGDNIRIMSDGKQEDWIDAIGACVSCVSYGDDFVLSNKD